MDDKRFLSAALVGMVLLAGGYTALARADALEAPDDPRVAGPNFAINENAESLGDIRAHNSPSVARNPGNPDNLVVADRVDSPGFGCGLHVSFDDGESWSHPGIEIPAGEEPKCFAPFVAFAGDGTLYLTFVTLQGLGNSPNAVWLAVSKDGGRTFEDAVKILDELAFQVQLLVDPADPRRLHLTWLQAEVTGNLSLPQPGNPILYKASGDAGLTWTEPVRVSAPDRERVVAPSAAFGPDGTIYVAYLDLGEDRLDYEGAHQGMGGEPYPGPWYLMVATASPDATRWRNVEVEEIVATQRLIVFLPPFPGLAVHPDGTIFVTFADGRLGDPDVVLWRSDDNGASFSGPIRVNDTRLNDGTDQYLPRIDVAPGGRVDVLYYDRRSDPNNVRNEVSIQSSFDNGRTFEPRILVSSESFSSRIGWGEERGMPELGSRLGLLSDDRRALAVWTDTRGSNISAIKQNIYGAYVSFDGSNEVSEAAADWIRFGGAGAMVLGGLVVLGAPLALLFAGRRNKSQAGGREVEDVESSDAGSE